MALSKEESEAIHSELAKLTLNEEECKVIVCNLAYNLCKRNNIPIHEDVEKFIQTTISQGAA